MQRERDRDRQTDRQKDRHTDRHTDTQTHRQTNGQMSQVCCRNAPQRKAFLESDGEASVSALNSRNQQDPEDDGKLPRDEKRETRGKRQRGIDAK